MSPNTNSNHIILKQRVSRDSIEENLFFLLNLFKEQKICKKDFQDVILYDFGDEFEHLQNMLKKLKIPESNLVKFNSKNQKLANENIPALAILLFPENKSITSEEEIFLNQKKAAITIANVYTPEPDFSKNIESWTNIVENGIIKL